MGIDEVGIDKVGIDEVGRYPPIHAVIDTMHKYLSFTH